MKFNSLTTLHYIININDKSCMFIRYQGYSSALFGFSGSSYNPTRTANSNNMCQYETRGISKDVRRGTWPNCSSTQTSHGHIQAIKWKVNIRNDRMGFSSKQETIRMVTAQQFNRNERFLEVITFCQWSTVTDVSDGTSKLGNIGFKFGNPGVEVNIMTCCHNSCCLPYVSSLASSYFSNPSLQGHTRFQTLALRCGWIHKEGLLHTFCLVNKWKCFKTGQYLAKCGQEFGVCSV